VVLFLIAVPLLIGTIADIMIIVKDKSRKEATNTKLKKVILGFSIIANGKMLLKTTKKTNNRETITCLNGIRYRT
jgi:hypothetical protein